MKKILFLIVVLVMTMSGVYGQTNYDWLDTAPDGNWKRGSDGARWNPGGLWEEPPVGNILIFNNNHQLTMTNNVSSYSIHQLIFGNSNNNTRSISGNDLIFNDFGGAVPKIENQSSVVHNISFNIIGDPNDPLEINPVSGDLNISGTISNSGSDVLIYGDNSKLLTISGVVSGNGKLILKEYSKVLLTANNTFSGNTEIDEGELWIQENGDIAGDFYLGNGSQLTNVTNLNNS